MKKIMPLFIAVCLLLTMLTGTVSVFAEEGYQVRVTDEEGNPVSGVMVQFCSDTECMMARTDDDGLAPFDQPAGSYTVHVLKVPEGFSADGTEYTAPETPGLIEVTLAKEAAEDLEEAAEDENIIDVPQAGFHFEVPGKYQNLKGIQEWSASYLDPGLIEIIPVYYAVSPDQADAYNEYCEAYIDTFQNGEEPPEAPDPSWMSGRESGWMFNIYAINGGRGEAELREITKKTSSRGDNFAWLEEIGKDGDTTFFLGQFAELEENKDEYKEAMGSFYDEFVSLYTDKETFLSALTMSTPEWITETAVGDVISFETTDLDGNPVSAEELFAGHKVTMINLWATWCGPCKQELPELARMAEEFEKEGCQIIGVVHDSGDEGKTELAKQLLEEAGAGYLNIAAPENLYDVLPNVSLPTSYFVDSEGRLLVDPVKGAALADYPEALKEALAPVE